MLAEMMSYTVTWVPFGVDRKPFIFKTREDVVAKIWSSSLFSPEKNPNRTGGSGENVELSPVFCCWCLGTPFPWLPWVKYESLSLCICSMLWGMKNYTKRVFLLNRNVKFNRWRGTVKVSPSIKNTYFPSYLCVNSQVDLVWIICFSPM